MTIGKDPFGNTVGINPPRSNNDANPDIPKSFKEDPLDIDTPSAKKGNGTTNDPVIQDSAQSVPVPPTGIENMPGRINRGRGIDVAKQDKDREKSLGINADE